MDAPSSRGLVFLLSLGAIPLGCSDGDGESDTEATTATATATTTGTTTAGTGTATTTGGTTTGSASETGTSTMTTAGSDTDDTTTTGEPAGLCEDYAARAIECYPRDSFRDALQYCQDDLAKYAEIGPECEAAAVDYYKCVAAAPCESDNACDQEVGYLFTACLPEPGPACMAYAAKIGECEGLTPEEIDSVGSYCQTGINFGVEEYGAACGAAYEEFYACLGALSCDEIGGDGACPGESADVEMECGGP